MPNLRAARAVLHARGEVATQLLREPLARSWSRCIASGLDAASLGRDEPEHGERLRTAIERHRTFLAHARPVMGFVHDMIRGSGHLVVLSDADGLLLHATGDDSFVARAQRVALQPGACWSERIRGTNAIGTALFELAPVVVHGEEHFLEPNVALTCSAAPVLDSAGRALGVIDVSGDHRSRHPHTLGLVRSAARMIEDRIFAAEHATHLRIALHPQAEGVLGVGAALVAVDDDGRFTGANGTARAWLGLRANDLPACVESVLGVSVDALLGSTGRVRALVLPNGTRLFVRAEAPPARASSMLAIDVGSSRDPRLDRLRERAERALAAGLPVLLQGESGSGKDVFARTLHEGGPRRRGPFVAVNCASIPEALVEAELFGYVGGAFTGARREGSAGLFREADGGTLFLDEIGDMPLSLQTRLLRVLEERRVTPLGSSKATAVDVHVVGATNRNLQEAVANGAFRGDLYYRLAGLVVTLPPLRERADFDALCEAILHEVRPTQRTRLAPTVAASLRRYEWPGNLRQLRSVLTAAAAMLDPDEDVVDWPHLPDDVQLHLRGENALAKRAATPHSAVDLRSLSDCAIREAVSATGHNMSEAARRLGISRNTLYRRLRRMHDRPS